MAKGQQVKQERAQKILETFEGSFLYNGGKEIRVNMTEAGEPVQVKIALTAAKVAVSPEDESAVPAPAKSKNAFDIAEGAEPSFGEEKQAIEPTDEEKANIGSLLESLGL